MNRSRTERPQQPLFAGREGVVNVPRRGVTPQTSQRLGEGANETRAFGENFHSRRVYHVSCAACHQIPTRRIRLVEAFLPYVTDPHSVTVLDIERSFDFLSPASIIWWLISLYLKSSTSTIACTASVTVLYIPIDPVDCIGEPFSTQQKLTDLQQWSLSMPILKNTKGPTDQIQTSSDQRFLHSLEHQCLWHVLMLLRSTFHARSLSRDPELCMTLLDFWRVSTR